MGSRWLNNCFYCLQGSFMDKKNKGLADNQDGDIILNESGTSVSFGWDAGESGKNNETTSQETDKENSKGESCAITDKGLTSKL